MPWRPISDGLSSMLTLKNTAAPACRAAAASKTGAILRHGLHHGAQKSTSTGESERRTCCSNSCSSTGLTLLLISALLSFLSTLQATSPAAASDALPEAVLPPRAAAPDARAAPATAPRPPFHSNTDNRSRTDRDRADSASCVARNTDRTGSDRRTALRTGMADMDNRGKGHNTARQRSPTLSITDRKTPEL